MDWAAWMTLAIVAGMVGTLIFSRLAADAVFLGAVTVLMISGIITPKEAFSGFGNEGLITVGVLCVVAVALEETGGIHWLVQNVLRKPFSLRHALWRTMAPTAVFSAFLNNTPQVSMMIPAINSWAKKFNLPASKLLLPMNYATILGGTCALIGTSTNLIVNGMVQPGDVAELHVKVKRPGGKIWKFTGEVQVDGQVCASAEFTAMMAVNDAADG